MSRELKISIAQILTFNALFVLGAIASLTILRIFALLLLLTLLLIQSEDRSIKLLFGLAPVQAIVVLTDSGISLLGVCYLLLFVKRLLTKRFKIECSYFFAIVPLLLISVALFVQYKTFYDFAIICEISVVILYLSAITKEKNSTFFSELLSAFLVGAFACSINIFFMRVMSGNLGDRANGILDNANYIAITFVVASLLCLIRFVRKRRDVRDIIAFLFFLFMLLITGSRGAILAIAGGLLWILFFGLYRYRKTRLILFVLLLAFGVSFVLYLAGFPAIVNIYDNLVLRTLNGLDRGSQGYFMDVSSGRLTLWNYYINAFNHMGIQKLFGLGSDRYYLASNGGYDFYAHNVFIGALMGIGALGLAFSILLYIIFYKKISKEIKKPCQKSVIVLSLFVSIIIGYFFLDGIFDLRLVVYIVIACALKKALFLAETQNQKGITEAFYGESVFSKRMYQIPNKDV